MDNKDDKTFLQTIAVFLAGFGIGKATGQNPKRKKRYSLLIVAVVVVLLIVFWPSGSKETYSRIQWPDNELASLIPEPKLKAGNIAYDSETYLHVKVKASQKEFDAYVERCADRGFIVDYYHSSTTYQAKDEFGNYLWISYDSEEQVMGIHLDKAKEPERDEVPIPEPEPSESSQEPPPALTETQAAAPLSYSDCMRQNYLDIVHQFERAGFTNIQTEAVADLVNEQPTENEAVKGVLIDGQVYFNENEVFEKDTPVIVRYYVFQPKDDEPTDNQDEVVLTIDNCEELAAVLQNENEVDSTYAAFARDYKGRTIQFDGNISSAAFHSAYNPITGETKTYDTVLDILINVGDFNEDGMPGPIFKFDGVSAIRLPSIDVGDNCVITAKVGAYDSNTGVWELSYEKIVAR